MSRNGANCGRCARFCNTRAAGGVWTAAGNHLGSKINAVRVQPEYSSMVDRTQTICSSMPLGHHSKRRCSAHNKTPQRSAPRGATLASGSRVSYHLCAIARLSEAFVTAEMACSPYSLRSTEQSSTTWRRWCRFSNPFCFLALSNPHHAPCLGSVSLSGRCQIDIRTIKPRRA
jgi:hypothetical protein